MISGVKPKTLLNTILLTLSIFTVIFILFFIFNNFLQPKVGMYSYLGEKRSFDEAHSQAFKFFSNIAKGRKNCTKGSQLVFYSNDSKVYAICNYIYTEITFPREGGEKLELPFYIGRVRDYRKVWSTVINAIIRIPEAMEQGVYKSPNVDNYYFKIVPMLPLCITFHNPANEYIDVKLAFTLYINNAEIKPYGNPITFGFDGKWHNITMCFDIISESFSSLTEEMLLEKGHEFKNLTKLSNEVINLTYHIELYANKEILNKSFTIKIFTGLPGILVRE
ncbi:MAG: hypothetical protein DRO40_08145 [Thermoprotei archaeon]|nr:MAG: hypothetical protein DRO40_08145 [Thermoprotei archaeon]